MPPNRFLKLPRDRSRLRLPLLAVVPFLLLSACAPGMVPGGVPSAAEIPSLEQEIRERPGDMDVRVRLGAGYLELDRPADALRILEPATAAVPPRTLALFLTGGALEAEERYTDAREAYERYLEVADDARLRGTVEERLALIRRRELEAEVRTTLAREAELADTPSDPTTIAVFPFAYDGTDPEYRPLSRALAGMLVTDLARVDRVRVLERLRVQLLLDEIALAEEERVDPATAARSGRLLGAGRVVQGRIGGDERLLSVLAGLVATEEGARMASVDDEDALEAFFDLQKRIVLSLFETMGVQLTPAERELVLDRPTASLRALLLYGQALEAMDQGDFPGAAELFRQAAEEDPGFEEAAVQAELAEAMGRHADVTARVFALEALEEIVPGPAAPPTLEGIRSSVRPVEFLIPGPEGRDAGAELLGTEGIGLGQSTIVILLRRPL